MEEGGQEVVELGEGAGGLGVPAKLMVKRPGLACYLGARPTATKEDKGAWTSPVMSPSHY